MKEKTASLPGRFAAAAAEVLGDRLAGVYLHGSAAMGCFHPERSDLDFLVVVSGPMTDDEKLEFLEKVAALDAEGPAKGIEMSVVLRDACDPFVYPTPFLLHYSRGHAEWYRRDPADYIRKMSGTDRDLAAHFTVVRTRGVRLSGLPVREVFGPVPEKDYLDALMYDVASAEKEIADNPLYLVLNLARVLAFTREKLVLSKKEGGEWGLEHLPEEYRPLLRAALRDYGGGKGIRYDPALLKRYAAFMLDAIASPGPVHP